MSLAPRVNADQPANAAQFEEFESSLTGLFLKSMERFGEIQKQTLDFAVQQNSEILDAFKKMSTKMPGGPNLPVFELAEGAVARYADTQKSAINFVLEQSKVWSDALKNRNRSTKEAMESNTKTAKQSLERAFGVTKRALDNSAAQAKAVLDAAKEQFGPNGPQVEAVTDSFKKGIDTLIDAQKEVMNLVAH